VRRTALGGGDGNRPELRPLQAWRWFTAVVWHRPRTRADRFLWSLVAGLTVLVGSVVLAADRPQWGEQFSRNMVSAEVGLPESFDPESGRNVKWVVPLGTQCYSTPVVASGRVIVGTNNHRPRDERHQGDRGVLMCFSEEDGQLLWQLVVPKLEGDIYLDWPRVGICSTATVEGDRVYVVTNRDEVVCLDLAGLENGNQGPFTDEAAHATPQGDPLVQLGPLDADIVWLVDLRAAAGVRPHDAAHSSILLDGDLLYVNTSNGLNSRHTGVEKPEAPSLVVIDKHTGRIVARDGQPIGPRIFHSTWSSPSLGEVLGRRLVFFAGGDGVIYALLAVASASDGDGSPARWLNPDRPVAPLPIGPVPSLHAVWRFDCDPTAPKENVHRYIRNRKVSPSTIMSMPVFHEGKLYVTCGGDIWWGKHEAYLKCVDTRGSGDITSTNLLWSYPLGRHCCSTPSVWRGMVFVADCDGKVHCVDATTGQPYWVHDAEGQIWGSTLVADGKLYVGTRAGDFWILAADKKKHILARVTLGEPINTAPVAANGVLFVATMSQLYALQQQ